MVYFNEYIISHRSCEYLSKIGIRELITETHRPEGPGSTRPNKNNNVIDGIWGSPGPSTTSCGYLPVNYGLKPDHRLIRVKKSLGNALGDKILPSKTPSDWKSAFIIQLVSINTSTSSNTLPDNTTCFLGLENLRITKNVLLHLKPSRSMKKSRNYYSKQDQNLTLAPKRLHMRNVQSSRTVKVDQLCLWLVTTLTQIIDKEGKIKLKTITKLSYITGIRWCPPPQHYHPPPPKTKYHERIPPLQEELYHTQSHIFGRKGPGNGKNREHPIISKDKLSPHKRKRQGEIQAAEIPPAKQ